jgi:hypothetical protein
MACGYSEPPFARSYQEVQHPSPLLVTGCYRHQQPHRKSAARFAVGAETTLAP